MNTDEFLVFSIIAILIIIVITTAIVFSAYPKKPKQKLSDIISSSGAFAIMTSYPEFSIVNCKSCGYDHEELRCPACGILVSRRSFDKDEIITHEAEINMTNLYENENTKTSRLLKI